MAQNDNEKLEVIRNRHEVIRALFWKERRQNPTKLIKLVIAELSSKSGYSRRAIQEIIQK